MGSATNRPRTFEDLRSEPSKCTPSIHDSKSIGLVDIASRVYFLQRVTGCAAASSVWPVTPIARFRSRIEALEDATFKEGSTSS